MAMLKLFGILTLILALILAGWTSAWALRCGKNLVNVGDRKLEVLYRCGEPDLVDIWEEGRSGHFYYYGHWYPNTGTVVVEMWSYNFGPSRFMRILRFENGRLTRIETIGYGY